MADNTPFGNINIEAGSTERSASWYQRQVRSYASHLNSPAELYDSDLGRFESKLEVGQMYLFEYKPKHADTLPYYDNFPLVVIADAIPKAILINTGASAFGNACLKIVLFAEYPSDSAA